MSTKSTAPQTTPATTPPVADVAKPKAKRPEPPVVDQAKLNNATSKAEELLEQTVVELIFNEPFYANLLMGMRREFTISVPTLGVNVTDQVNLYINPYFFNAMTLPERVDVLKHECVSGDTLVTTDKGKFRIKDIVDKKMQLKALSINDNGEKEFKTITNFSKKDIKNFPKKRWISLKYAKSPFLYSNPTVTNDHKIAVVKDLLNPKITFVNAENSLNSFSVRSINQERNFNKERAVYNKDQISVIIGCMLGDSYISKQGAFSTVASKKHKDYLFYKHKILGGNIEDSYSGYLDTFSNLRINHGVTEQSKFIRSLFYERNKKTVKNIVNMLNPISLAYWYMDDGSYDNYGSSFLHTEGFTLSDNKLLVKSFKDIFNIDCEVHKRSKKELYNIKFKMEGTKKLHELIAPFIHSSMEYKLREEYRNLYKKEINMTHLAYSLRKVVAIKERKRHKSFLYDITVAKNHNFFANDTLVHNCHHVLNNHFVRFRDIEPRVFENTDKSIFERIQDMQKASLTNQAADFAINEYLPNLPRKVKMFDQNGNAITTPTHIEDATGKKIVNPDKNAGKPIESDLCFVDNLKKKYPNINNKQTMEYYYEFLKQEQENNGGDGTGMIVLDDHDLWHETDNTEDDITQKVKDAVNKAVEQTADKDMGKMSGDVLSAIEKLNHQAKDWRQDIQKFVARSAEIIIESTRKRRNRRYGILHAGTRTYPKLNIAVAIDTSGSVNDECISQFHSEIVRLHNMNITLTILECDTQVNRVYVFDPKKPFTIVGRGGTAFKPVFDRIESDKMEIDGLIYFSDGECYNEDIKKPRYSVLWALCPPFKLHGINFGAQTKIEIRKRVRR